MSEPRTAAGRALHREMMHLGMQKSARVILAIEQEAAAIDVERLARALDAVYRDKWPDQRESHRPPTTVFGGYAEDIAREYEKLRTPEGEG